MRAALTLTLAGLAVGGCYLSHQRAEDRPDVGLTDGGRSDARDAIGPVDVGPCGIDGLTIRASLFWTRSETEGDLGVVGRSGLFYWGDEQHRFELCAPRSEAPLTLYTVRGNTHLIFGVTESFDSEIWALSAAVTRGGPVFDEHGTVEHTEADSRFIVQPSPDVITDFGTASDIDLNCLGVFSDCRIRFLEVSVDGRLLGAGEVLHHNFPPASLPFTLDGRGTAIETASYEVELPSTGLLAGLVPVERWALDCGGQRGDYDAPLGSLDTWRCGIAGILTATGVVDGVETGTIQYAAGATRHADTILVRVASADGSLEGTVVGPCCGAGSERLHFPEARTLEARGLSEEDMDVEVDTDFDFGFLEFVGFDLGDEAPRAGDGTNVWIVGSGTASLAEAPEEYRSSRRSDPVRWVYVGALSTSDAQPWADSTLRSSVRRRVDLFR